MYQCMTCQGHLIDNDDKFIVCSECGSSYPTINGIPVFIHDASASLQGYFIEIEEVQEGLKSLVASFSKLQDEMEINEFSERVERTKQGAETNASFLQEIFQPIIDSGQITIDNNDLLAWSMVKTGTTIYEMLPYFYQDWAGTQDFEKLNDRICNTIADHCRDRDSVAVLGAGACGLLHSVSDYFQVSYGVDLSLPTLITAKTLIEGNPLTFSLPTADWQTVSLTPPPPSANNIRYLVANVNNMPFESASLSLVITQYLLDIVSNPALLIREIRRVLKPGGLWINFSNPFRIANDPPQLGKRRLNELPPLFKQFGFDVISLDNERFNFLNLENVSPIVHTLNQHVQYFTVQKNNDSGVIEQDKPIARFFSPNTDVWHEIPRIVKDRGIVFSKQKAYNGEGGFNEWQLIDVMGYSFVIPEDFCFVLETLFLNIDGQRNLRELFVMQEAVTGLDEKSFLKLIYILNILHYLIEL